MVLSYKITLGKRMLERVNDEMLMDVQQAVDDFEEALTEIAAEYKESFRIKVPKSSSG